MPERTFFPFCTSHVIVLVLTVLVCAVMILLRRRNCTAAVWLERLLVVALLLAWPASTYAHLVLGDYSRQNAYPFHLCDVAAYAGAIALLTRARLAAEVCYFFGLAGTLQGLITPNLQENFPHPRFLAFFLGHSAIVIASVYMVTGLALIPRPGALLRMLGCILGYAAIVGGLNALLRTNYGFLCAKPLSPSLMDVLGPWPWYIGSLIGLAFVFFALLNLPFVLQRAGKKEIALPSPGA